MSQIFDALQKSEAERRGTSEALAVDELLREAESRVASRAGSRDPAAGNGVLDGGNAAESAISLQMLRHEFESLAINPVEESRLICLPGNESVAVEAFHLLGVRLRHLRKERILSKILITSSIPQEGKSVSAANLACTLARKTQQRTLLLEGDIRRPTQARIFGIRPKWGLSAWLKGEADLMDCIYKLEGLGLYILPAGEGINLAPDILQPAKMSSLISQLEAFFDPIIIDSPPMLPLADASIWKNLADGVLLVTREGVTERKKLLRGLEAIEPQKLIGAIVNSSSLEEQDGYYYRSDQSLETA